VATIKVQRARFEIWQGEDFAATVRVEDEDGFAVDLTYHGGEAQLRADVKDAPAPVLATAAVELVPNQWVDAAGTPGWNAVVRIDRTQTSPLSASNMPDGNGRIDGWVDDGVERKPFVVAFVRLALATTEDL
jgi:hypothetical protein